MAQAGGSGGRAHAEGGERKKGAPRWLRRAMRTLQI